MDRYEVAAHDYQKNVSKLGKIGSTTSVNAFYQERDKSPPSSGWGQMIDSKSGKGIMIDDNNLAIPSDQVVA